MWMGVVRMCADMYFPQCVCGGWRQPPGVVLFFYSGIWGSILGHTAYKPFYPEDFYLVSPGRLLSCQPCTDFICKTDILIFEFFQSLFCLSHKRRICLECQIVVLIKDTDLHLKKLEKGTCFMVHKNYCFPKIALKLLFRKF